LATVSKKTERTFSFQKKRKRFFFLLIYAKVFHFVLTASEEKKDLRMAASPEKGLKCLSGKIVPLRKIGFRIRTIEMRKREATTNRYEVQTSPRVSPHHPGAIDFPF